MAALGIILVAGISMAVLTPLVPDEYRSGMVVLAIPIGFLAGLLAASLDD